MYFVFNEKATYEMRISDWCSDVCSSDLYKKWYRKPASGSGETQLILDEFARAAGKDYFRLAELSVSPNGKLMAYSFDDNGSERFEARIRNLETGELLPDTIPGTLSSLVWTSGNDAILYGLANENWRTDNVRLHKLGTPVTQDKLPYTEDRKSVE